nr:MAG TPA: hypothetical protein [Caudoviricetes sp.]
MQVTGVVVVTAPYVVHVGGRSATARSLDLADPAIALQHEAA